MSKPANTALARVKNLVGMVKRPKPAVGQTLADSVHQENKWQLLRYRARPEGLAYKTPILLVPSLINRHYVLDLMPGKSFVEYLVDQGHDVYIIDWGTPTAEDRYLSFDDICDVYLGRAVRKAARLSGVSKVHLLGYCLGGTLTTIYAARRPEHVASLLALAAPVHFTPEGLLATWVRSKQFDIKALVDATGLVPWPLMQSAFHMLRPTMNLSKTVYLLDRAWDDEFLDGFFAAETWSNDNVSFPGACYERYIQELYREDKLVRGEFALGGRPVRLEDITCPTLAVAFYHDHIVPLSSAAPLIELVGAQDKDLWSLSGGHVGAVISRKASQTLWPKMAGFFAERDALGL
jgi:polyhydroxyalkanoate synthase subunit PhaC